MQAAIGKAQATDPQIQQFEKGEKNWVHPKIKDIDMQLEGKIPLVRQEAEIPNAARYKCREDLLFQRLQGNQHLLNYKNICWTG